MRSCDLCSAAPIARLGYLGDRSDRRVWLCTDCYSRLEEHDLAPDELLGLARLSAQREGRCEWCAKQPPAAQVRVPMADGRLLAFNLCATCAQDAHRDSGGQILHGQAARDGETTIDPRYEHALQVKRRRRQMRRVK